MDPVQFEPKISTDLQVNWRRSNTGAGADMFTDMLADQMKRRAEADQQDLDARRREASRSRREGSDPVSGRPPRVAVAHPKTLRGDAKEIDESGERRLPARSDAAPDDDTKGVGDQTADGSKADGSKAGAKGKAAKAKAKTDAAEAADQPAQPTAGRQPAPDPNTTAVVAVQAGSSKATDTGKAPASTALALPAPASAGQQAASPAPAKASGANKMAAGDDAASGGAPKQTPIDAAAAAALSDALAALDTGKTEPAGAASPPAGAPQASPLTITAVLDKQPLPPALQPTLQPAAPTAGAVPPIKAATRPASDAKAHGGSPAQGDAGTSDPDPKPASAPAAQPYPVAPAQQLAALETGADGDAFDSAFPTDSSAPGWALHLAQGTAGRRADFVAQLRQHLQNLPIQEQVAVHVQRALREGAGRVSIQLSPDELGRIHVKLDIDKDKRVTAAVTVERPSTLDLLQRDVKGLERALQDAGLNMDSGDLSFSLGHGGDQEFAQDLGRSAAGGPSALVSDARSEPDLPESHAGQVTDTAAGVVNLQV
ncbi:MAG TPA: flagellar hook-length control protein FliK [Acetobacteraceae bacterium]|nr:flagellar hook-length control protein FliK [Acetobacteraceae bacterium]